MEETEITTPAFFTFGMIIIDEIEYNDGRPRATDVLGGAGTYAALGATLAAGRDHHSVSWIVDKGVDFPDTLVQLIDSWHTNCVWRTDLTRKTTRAWNGYDSDQNRAFRYMAPKKRISVEDLNNDQVMSASLHMVCSPARCSAIAVGIMERRNKLYPDAQRPLLVWEPIPDLCVPEERVNVSTAAKWCSVVSPNAGELRAFFADRETSLDRKTMVQELVRGKPGIDPCCPAWVVRDGSNGCYLIIGSSEIRFPAYHRHKSYVLDPTGGGNAFLGALAIALTGRCTPSWNTYPDFDKQISISIPFQIKSIWFAVIHATIAASFAIEQVGMPQVDLQDPQVWNGISYTERFGQYLDRESNDLVSQLNRWS